MVEPPQVKKEKPEAAVLGEVSLGYLAKEIGHESAIQLGMMLNIPTKCIVTTQLKCAGDPTALTRELVVSHWKPMRAGAKDKDKVNEMDRVLRELNKLDAADVWMERHRNNQEITPDAFQ